MVLVHSLKIVHSRVSALGFAHTRLPKLLAALARTLVVRPLFVSDHVELLLLVELAIKERRIEWLQLVGISPPVAIVALLVVPLEGVTARPGILAAKAMKVAEVALVPLQTLVEVDGWHVQALVGIHRESRLP